MHVYGVYERGWPIMEPYIKGGFFQYVSALETTPMRREKLKAGWYFDCKCGRCTDPTENESFASATR